MWFILETINLHIRKGPATAIPPGMVREPVSPLLLGLLCLRKTMPRRRYISTNISTDKRVNSVSEFAALIYTWATPHAADDCRLTPQNAEEFKMLVVPGTKRTLEEVGSAIQEILAAGLWGVDEEGRYFIPSKSFYKYQTYISAANRRETPEITASSSLSSSSSSSLKEDPKKEAAPADKPVDNHDKPLESKGKAPPPGDNSNKEEEGAKELAAMVDYIYRKDKARFAKIPAWANTQLKKGWKAPELLKALVKFNLRDAQGEIREWWPYLTEACQAIRTQELQGEAASHVVKDPSSMGGILEYLKKGEA